MNINEYLKEKLKVKIISVNLTGHTIKIVTEKEMDSKDIKTIEDFLKYGINSIWKFKEQKEKEPPKE